MERRGWIFMEKLSDLQLKYNTEDLIIDNNLYKKYLQEFDRVKAFWEFICYETELWQYKGIIEELLKMDDSLMSKLLAGAAINSIESAAKDETCKKCEHLSSKQLKILLTIGGGFSTCKCDTCKDGSNFSERKR